MAEVSAAHAHHEDGLFNGPLESGVRSVVILNAAHPKSFDLKYLTWLDHLVVHTSDIGGPDSLHPSIPQRSGELIVRRRLVEDGLKLMRKLHLVDAIADSDGIRFVAGEDAAPFVLSMRTAYGTALRERAQWLAVHIKDIADDAMHALIQERIGRWAVEFQNDTSPGGALF